MLDIVVPVLFAAVTSVTAYLGVHVTLYPATTHRSLRNYKIAFGLCIAASLGLTVWQIFRNFDAQEKQNIAQEKLSDTLRKLDEGVQKSNERPLKPPDVHIYPPKSPSVKFSKKTRIRFEHGLNTKSPQVSCYVDGQLMEPYTVTPTDENTTVIAFVYPVSGTCSAR